MSEIESEIIGADLFCGAGGTSAGMYDAVRLLGRKLNLVAVNHWCVAIKTHSYNHKAATHLCEDLGEIDPLYAVPGKRLDILAASPECTHHSNARGGKPRSEQSRASANQVIKWLKMLDVENLMVENVKEFIGWGPLYPEDYKVKKLRDKPIKERKGEFFKAWVKKIEECGYRVEWRVLNSADYGAATARRRVYILAKKGKKEIKWPESTHGDGTGVPHRSAREIIDWSYPSKSIFSRKKPLAKNTMRRIEVGLKKFCGEPFLAMMYGTGGARSVDKPLPTHTAQGNHMGLCEPFLLHQMEAGGCKSLDDPLPTITTKCGHGLVEPFLIEYHGSRNGSDEGDRRSCSLDNPLPVQDCSNRFGLVEPFLVNMKGQSNAMSVSKPMPTQCSKSHLYLCEPFLTKYYGTGEGAVSVDKPLDTITTKDRFGLVEPEETNRGYDIKFRMLQPHELADAMGMGDFTFFGRKGDITKQIGNAVERNVARALCTAMLS